MIEPIDVERFREEAAKRHLAVLRLVETGVLETSETITAAEAWPEVERRVELMLAVDRDQEIFAFAKTIDAHRRPFTLRIEGGL